MDWNQNKSCFFQFHVIHIEKHFYGQGRKNKQNSLCLTKNDKESFYWQRVKQSRHIFPNDRQSLQPPWNFTQPALMIDCSARGGKGREAERGEERGSASSFFSSSFSKNSLPSWLHRPTFPGQRFSFTVSSPCRGRVVAVRGVNCCCLLPSISHWDAQLVWASNTKSLKGLYRSVRGDTDYVCVQLTPVYNTWIITTPILLI